MLFGLVRGACGYFNVSDSCLFFEKQMFLGTACLHLKSHNINNNPTFSFIRGCDGAKHSAALYRGFSSSSLGCLYELSMASLCVVVLKLDKI